MAIALTTGAIVFCLDRVTKALWFVAEPKTVAAGWRFLHTTGHKNFGISFDLPVPTWIIVAIAAAALVFLCSVALRTPPSRAFRLIAIGLILGGAAGNAFDRLTLGYVRDWLLFFELSAVNLADAAIVLGIVGWWGDSLPPPHR